MSPPEKEWWNNSVVLLPIDYSTAVKLHIPRSL